jgi:hypothetical protein
MKTYTIQMSDVDLKAVAGISHTNALHVIDVLLNQSESSVNEVTGMSMGFGSFKGHADEHPLLNDVLVAFVDNGGVTTNISDKWPKISAIKFIRAITNWSLKEGKDFVETAVGKNGVRLF